MYLHNYVLYSADAAGCGSGGCVEGIPLILSYNLLEGEPVLQVTVPTTGSSKLGRLRAVTSLGHRFIIPNPL
jgi:hypothetical protein